MQTHWQLAQTELGAKSNAATANIIFLMILTLLVRLNALLSGAR
jgi:hypothetical protein